MFYSACQVDVCNSFEVSFSLSIMCYVFYLCLFFECFLNSLRDRYTGNFLSLGPSASVDQLLLWKSNSSFENGCIIQLVFPVFSQPRFEQVDVSAKNCSVCQDGFLEGRRN